MQRDAGSLIMKKKDVNCRITYEGTSLLMCRGVPVPKKKSATAASRAALDEASSKGGKSCCRILFAGRGRLAAEPDHNKVKMNGPE